MSIDPSLLARHRDGRMTIVSRLSKMSSLSRSTQTGFTVSYLFRFINKSYVQHIIPVALNATLIAPCQWLRYRYLNLWGREPIDADGRDSPGYFLTWLLLAQHETCWFFAGTSPTEIPTTVSTVGIQTSTIGLSETNHMNELTNHTVQADESNRQLSASIGLWWVSLWNW